MMPLHHGVPPARRPAAFLDRDGTLNRHLGYLSHADQVELLPGASRAVLALNRAGVLAVVVTNQPVVAMGLCSLEELARIHDRLQELLRADGAFLDRIYVCLHGRESSAGQAAGCKCRKPEPGLIEQAVSELPIDLSRSAVFGDSWRDVELARRAGLPSYRVGEGAVDLETAVGTWLEGRLPHAEKS
jgi:histidinol-phosphate phosphatase family protein